MIDEYTTILRFNRSSNANSNCGYGPWYRCDYKKNI